MSLFLYSFWDIGLFPSCDIYTVLICLTTYLDVYSLFSVVAIHIFQLGVPRMLEEAAIEHLRCTTNTTDNYKT